MRRVVVTGMGAMTCAGNGVDAAWAAALAGEPRYSADSVGTMPRPIGRVPMPQGTPPFDVARGPDPVVGLALAACAEAMGQAGLAGRIGGERLGCVIGSGAGGQQTHEQISGRLYGEGRSRVHPFTLPRGMFSAMASALAERCEARGVVYAVSSACASGVHAIGQAVCAIRAGMADAMIAGGSEASLTPGCLAAWDALHVLSPLACRPFSADRDGLVLAEGAAILILEDRAFALARGATILAEIAGYGACSDATALTAPDVGGMARAMRLALADAGMAPDAIGAVNAHGTGTALNDRCESAALIDVFGADSGPPVTATKSVLGHALGASGAIEAIISIRSLQEAIVPPTAGFLRNDPDCPIDCVVGQGRALAQGAIISNSFAFGGLNASLVLRRG